MNQKNILPLQPEHIFKPTSTGFEPIAKILPIVLAAIQAQAAAQHKNDRPAHSGDRNMRWAA